MYHSSSKQFRIAYTFGTHAIVSDVVDLEDLPEVDCEFVKQDKNETRVDMVEMVKIVQQQQQIIGEMVDRLNELQEYLHLMPGGAGPEAARMSFESGQQCMMTLHQTKKKPGPQ